jgi:Spy/CpxP family protein refolding chaperone
MQTRTFLKFALLASSLLCATALPAFAQAGGGGGGGGGGRGSILTQEQRTAMREAAPSQSDLAPLTEKLQAAQKDAMKAVLAGASDDAIRAKIEAVNKAQLEVTMLRLKGIKAAAATLTSDQKSQLESAPGGGYGMFFGGMMMGGGGRGRRAGGGGGGNN